MGKAQLLLASQSPRRHRLLALLGLPFEIAAADVAETPRPGETPAELVARLSRAKARAADPDAFTNVVVIACDTVVALESEILGKPRDAAEATEMLRRLRARSHTVYSALTLLKSAASTTKLVETEVTMRSYTDEELGAYVASEDPLDKAGAYAVQHDGFHPVAQLRGCYASVVGLPLCHLARCLNAWRIRLPVDVPTVCQDHTGHRCTICASILKGR